jgi:hypothetical protein
MRRFMMQSSNYNILNWPKRLLRLIRNHFSQPIYFAVEVFMFENCEEVRTDEISRSLSHLEHFAQSLWLRPDSRHNVIVLTNLVILQGVDAKENAGILDKGCRLDCGAASLQMTECLAYSVKGTFGALQSLD